MRFGDGGGWKPRHYSPPKLTSRDRELIREIYEETSATTLELALAFGVSRATIYVHIDTGSRGHVRNGNGKYGSARR